MVCKLLHAGDLHVVYSWILCSRVVWMAEWVGLMGGWVDVLADKSGGL